MVFENRHTSLRQIAHEPEISHVYASTILIVVLGKRNVATRLVSKGLNFLQKRYRVQVTSDMLQFWSHISGTRHNWWPELTLQVYNMRTSQQVSEWVGNNEPKLKNHVKAVRKSRWRVLISSTSDFALESQTVNKAPHLSNMEQLVDFARQ